MTKQEIKSAMSNNEIKENASKLDFLAAILAIVVMFALFLMYMYEKSV